MENFKSNQNYIRMVIAATELSLANREWMRTNSGTSESREALEVVIMCEKRLARAANYFLSDMGEKI